MSARFTAAILRVGPTIPVGVELVQELATALLLVAFADRRGALAQALERAQEPTVRRVLPPHVAVAAPAVLAQGVEPAVVADPEVGVRLDVVARVLTEVRPAVDEARPVRAHVGERVAPGLGWRAERVG